MAWPFEQVRSWFGGKAQRAATEEPFFDSGWSDSSSGVLSATGVHVNSTTAMACAAVMACVSIISEDMAKLTPRLRTRKPGGGWAMVENHPLVDLLDQPNDWQTWGEFCGQMTMGLCLRGNAYAVIVRGVAGEPKYLVPINPDQVSLWEAPDGSLFFMVTRAGLHETAVLAGQPLLIPAYNILHLKTLSSNGLLGFSKITLNREAIGLALAQEQQAARWMKNAAKPSGILTTDQKLTGESAERSKTNWQEVNAGLANSGKTAVLEQGLKWQALSMTSADIEFIASRNFQIHEIARMWRVPAHMIGDLNGIARIALTQLSQDYFNNTLSTYTKIWVDKICQVFGLRKLGIVMDFDRSILLEGDQAARFANYRLGLQGVFTSNECRDAEGLDPANEDPDAPSGDKVFRPVNMVPLGQEPAPGATAPGSDMGGENPGAGAPDTKAPDPEQAVRIAELATAIADINAKISRMPRPRAPEPSAPTLRVASG